MNLDKQSLREHLAQTRARLDGLFARLQAAEWETRVQGDDGIWSARQVVIHLAVSEGGQLAQLKGIADGGAGVGGDFDLHRWNNRQVEKLSARTVAELQTGMAASRVEVLAALDALNDEQMARRGRHARGDELSVAEIFYRIGEHELEHVEIIERALGAG